MSSTLPDAKHIAQVPQCFACAAVSTLCSTQNSTCVHVLIQTQHALPTPARLMHAKRLDQALNQGKATVVPKLPSSMCTDSGS